MANLNGPPVGSAASPTTAATAAAMSLAAGVSTGSSSSSSSTQQFCLKWNNHTANLVKTFTEMIADANFVDVTLACEGSSIKAHKVVLSACSNYFKDLFLANPCKHPIVILKDMKFDDLKAIIDFMYKGEVNVSQNQLGALLKTAEVLKVKGLTEVNEDSDKASHQEPQTHHGHVIPQSSQLNTLESVVKLDQSGCSSSAQETSLSGIIPTSTRKKRRRKSRPHGGGSAVESATSSSGEEVSCSESVSDDEQTIDIKRAKDVHGTSFNLPQNNAQPPPTQLPQLVTIPGPIEQSQNAAQNRRRVPQYHQQSPREIVTTDTSNGQADDVRNK